MFRKMDLSAAPAQLLGMGMEQLASKMVVSSLNILFENGLTSCFSDLILFCK